MCKTRLALCRWKRSISKQLQPARRRCNPVLMFLVRCVVASISYIIIIVIIIAAWRAGRSQWPIQKIVLQLDSLGYRVVLFRVILRLAVLVELRLVTDGQTDTGPWLVTTSV